MREVRWSTPAPPSRLFSSALEQVLALWVRQRLAALLAATDRAEGLGSLDARVRRAVVVARQYRSRHELFADRHWQGRPPAPGWCLDGTLAVRSLFDGYATTGVPSDQWPDLAHGLLILRSAGL
ncbi:hypothetical protein [Polymorphospora sp. NPDC050346]|uniref:hypothetical protein n=1 Tax=Polymorphospora sp. NPDC050346 TaxID=3155780 RepID=UPI00340073EF